MHAMKLKTFIQTLETIAPPELAEEWDNTGLLIEPLKAHNIQKVLLAIDLTDSVAREAVLTKADLVIAYHPLFFSEIKSLNQSNPQARSAMRLIQNNIAVYSPHTALDAAPGGVNDWLADTFGKGKIGCAPESSARIVELTTPVKLPTLETRIKKALKLSTIRTAAAHDRPIRTIALCAGAGIEALRPIQADLYFTGEMKHHDILAAVARGTSVILCGHTETERIYLPTLRSRLLAETDQTVDIVISKTDQAPLKAT